MYTWKKMAGCFAGMVAMGTMATAAGCDEVAGTTAPCLGSLATTCEPVDGLESIPIGPASRPPTAPPYEIQDNELGSQTLDCIEHEGTDTGDQMVRVDGEVWFASPAGRTVAPTAADGPLTFTAFDWEGPEGYSFPHGMLSYGNGRLGFYAQPFDCGDQGCDHERVHLWTLNEETGSFDEVVSEPAWQPFDAMRRAQGGWMVLGTVPGSTGTQIAAYQVTDDGEVLWGRGDISVRPADGVESLVSPGGLLWGAGYARMAITAQGDTVLLFLSHRAEEEIGFEGNLPIILRLDDQGRPVARTAISAFIPRHLSMAVDPSGPAYVALTDDFGDLTIHRIDRDGSWAWQKTVRREGYNDVLSAGVTTDTHGDLWLTITSGAREDMKAHLCRIPASGESMDCLRLPLNASRVLREELIVHGGHAFLRSFEPPSATIHVCKLPQD